jgi:plastocyanin
MKSCGTFLLGLLTIAGLAVSLVMSSGSASAATSTVPVGDLYFCSASFSGGVCTTTVTAGDTVVWDFSAQDAAHTVTACGASCDNPTSSPLFDSGLVQNHGTFQFTFTTAGTYSYYCQVHALQMRGQVVVQASAATPAAGTATPIRIAPPVDYGDSRSGLPPTGYGPQSHSSSLWWEFAALAVAGATLVSISALSFVRSKRR